MRKSEKNSAKVVVMFHHQTQTPRRAPSQTPTDAHKISGPTENGSPE